MEVWLPAPGILGYEVSSMGRFRNKRTQTVYKASISNVGYPRVLITKNYKQQQYHVHRLVAKAFVPNPGNKPDVNHIDGNKRNNEAENLEWVTNQENVAHYRRTIRPKRKLP